MTLKALIIRADGVLADVDELRRTALNRTVADAGFDWVCDRPSYALSLKFGATSQRMVSFIMPKLGYHRSSGDAEQLAAAMVRRKLSVLSELLHSTSLSARPGILDLVLAAKSEGLKLALVSPLQTGDAAQIARATLGPGGAERFDVIAASPSAQTDTPLEAIYRDALDRLGVDAGECLVLECRPHGLASAAAAHLRALVVRSAYSGDEPLDQAVFVADNLPSLIGLSGNSRLDPLTGEQRADLISALQNLHAGYSSPVSGPERTHDMKVSNILQSKGSSVKTVKTGTTVRELSQRLKADDVGVMVVVTDAGRITGIISERDVARGLSIHGAALPGLPVADLMTRAVITCTPEDSIAGISRIMTQRRIRHLPVVKGDELIGLISIGDVIKYRLDEMQLEANVLRDYALAKR